MRGRKYAPNSYVRDNIDRSMEKIMRENGVVRSEREKLIQAVRNDDKRAVHYFSEKLKRLRAEETYGKDY